MHHRDKRRVLLATAPELRCYLSGFADLADSEGFGWGHMATVGERIGRHPGSVRRALSSLVEGGAIEILGDRAGGRGRVTYWRIVIPRAAKGAHETARKARILRGVSISPEFERVTLPRGGLSAAEFSAAVDAARAGLVA